MRIAAQTMIVTKKPNFGGKKEKLSATVKAEEKSRGGEKRLGSLLLRIRHNGATLIAAVKVGDPKAAARPPQLNVVAISSLISLSDSRFFSLFLISIEEGVDEKKKKGRRV